MKSLINVIRCGDQSLVRLCHHFAAIVSLALSVVGAAGSESWAQLRTSGPTTASRVTTNVGQPKGVDLPSTTSAARQRRKISSISPFADHIPTRPETISSDSFSFPSVEVNIDNEGTQNGAEDSTLPPEVDLDGQPYVARVFADTSFVWRASDLFSNPLYFEDAPLERYGHTYCDHLQPFVSAGLFSTQLVGLPYQMAIDPFCKKMHSLGWYRPGEYAPRKFYQIPLSLRAAAAQARVVGGLGLLLP